MSSVSRRRSFSASRPWSYSLTDNIDYKQYLNNAQDLHEVNLLVEESVRSKIVSDPDLAKSAIISKRNADQISQAIAAVGGMTAGKISKSIGESADYISKSINESADRLSGSIEASANKVSNAVTKAGLATVEAIQLASDRNQEALEVLNFSIENVGRSIEVQSSLIGHGFSRTVAELGGINTTLKELLATARTPSQTWALEQYEIAKNAFELKLDSEALESLDRAINGFQNQTGYSLEPRFHFLCGTIKLGGIDRLGTDCVDLPGAEAAFLQAARVAPLELKNLRANCFAMAAQAACYLRAPDRTLKHASSAIQEYPHCANAHFISAKVFVSCEDEMNGKNALIAALRSDYTMALRALGDGDIGPQSQMLESAIDSVAKELVGTLGNAKLQLTELVDSLKSLMDVVGERPSDIFHIAGSLDEDIRAIELAITDGSLKNLVLAQRSLHNAASKLPEVERLGSSFSEVSERELRNSLIKDSVDIERKTKALRESLKETKAEKESTRFQKGFAFTILGAPVLALVLLAVPALGSVKNLYTIPNFLTAWLAISVLGWITRYFKEIVWQKSELEDRVRVIENVERDHATSDAIKREKINQLRSAGANFVRIVDSFSEEKKPRQIGLYPQ
jgi:hypothetical protein